MPASSNGEPMATTGWPTLRSSDRPSSTGVSPLTPLTFTTAMSVVGSRPTTCAAAFLPSWNTAWIWPPFAATSTTWLLVRM